VKGELIMIKELFKQFQFNFLLCFNRAMGRYGQTAYCKKSDVLMLLEDLRFKYRHHPIISQRLNETAEDIEDLKP
jgi:hypothetical protein